MIKKEVTVDGFDGPEKRTYYFHLTRSEVMSWVKESGGKLQKDLERVNLTSGTTSPTSSRWSGAFSIALLASARASGLSRPRRSPTISCSAERSMQCWLICSSTLTRLSDSRPAFCPRALCLRLPS